MFRIAYPGRGERRLRFSFPGDTAEVSLAMDNFKTWWPSWKAHTLKEAMKFIAEEEKHH